MPVAAVLSPMIASHCGGCKTIWDVLGNIALAFVVASALYLLFVWWPARHNRRAKTHRHSGTADTHHQNPIASSHDTDLPPEG